METTGWLSWTLLLPYPVTLWFVLRIANSCARLGRLWRLVGVLVSLMVGILCVGVGRYLAYGYIVANSSASTPTVVSQPVFGWAGIAGGALIGILGIWASLVRWKRKKG